MRTYATYVKTLDDLLELTAWGRNRVENELLHSHLNGGAAAELKSLVKRQQIRKSGAFFTGEALGRRMMELIPLSTGKDIPAWDPNCGAGDLLLRWSERLHVVDGDLRATLDHWSQKLHGIELHPQFVQAAKRRFALAAVSRGARMKRGRLSKLDEFFRGLECRNLLKGDVLVPEASVILMNPPFTMIDTPRTCLEWSSGKVAFAAVAVLNCLKVAKPGQQVVAILPDVLRSGSRYERWRKQVSQHSSIAKVDIVGRFSEHADVDVFILHATAGKGPSDIAWFQSNPKSAVPLLGDMCEVRVGTVVPHRHEHKGQKVAYLTASAAPAWEELHTLNSTIRHKGTCVNGPFLAIRRTSSPSDGSRAIATVVSSKHPIAVENHIITLRPKDGKLRTCRQLQESLKSDQVRRWLDRRIRCRHLTVGVLKSIPLPASHLFGEA